MFGIVNETDSRAAPALGLITDEARFVPAAAIAEQVGQSVEQCAGGSEVADVNVNVM
jgi:hypothetical protein